MKTVWACCLYVVTSLALGAETSVVTVLDGGARMLRGATWYRLAEGARVQDGDLIEAAEHAQVQVELATGDSLNIDGLAWLYVVRAPRDGKQTAEFYMPQGWIKLAAKPPSSPLRLRTSLGTIDAGSAIAVARVAANSLDLFVESGTARVSSLDAAPRDVHGGDFATRTTDRTLSVAGGASQAFVAAMPRHFMDTLPARADKYGTARVELVVDRPISFAEAEPWLNSPYRAAFIKRLQPRLADPAFRTAVMANVQAYPEWSSVLVPPSAPATTQAPAPPPEKKESGLPWPFGRR